MMTKRIIINALIIVSLTMAEAWSQQVIIRVSTDGSLVIQDRYGATERPLKQSNVIELTDSPLHVKIIHGSAGAGEALPMITRGRANHQGQVGAALSASPQTSPLPMPRPTPIPDTPISSLIDKTALEHGVDPGLVRLVVQKESGFNPQAVSPKGAMGLMQLMPGTASLLGVQDPFNPAQNIDGGVRYLKQCLERFNNNVSLALAAYNAGPENVAKYQGVPPFAETRHYVANIIREYTGQPVDLPGPPAVFAAQNPMAGRNLVKKPAISHTDLQPLFLPGGDRVNVIQSGKAKVIELVSP